MSGTEQSLATDPSPLGGTARAVLRGAGIILVITVVARIAGFVRYLVFGASVGAGDVGTAYSTANLLPNVLFEVVAGGALAAVVVPLVAGLVPERQDRDGQQLPVHGTETPTPGAADVADGRDRADRIISALLTWTLLITAALAAVVIVLAQPLTELLLGSEDMTGPGIDLGARLLRIFALQLPLYGIAVILGAYLQARKRFVWPALMPLLSSLLVMASYRVYAAMVPPVATASTIDPPAVGWLGWGTTAGVAVMGLPVLIASLHAGLRLRPTLRMPAGAGRQALALGAAGIGAVGAQQAVLGLVLLLAMGAGGTGTLPVFQYAQAVYLLPFAVLVVPLTTAVFPHLAELRLVGDPVAFARVSSASVRTVILMAVAGSAMLIAGAPAVEQFFRLVDRSGAAGVGSTSAALALGLAGYAVTTQCTRVLSAALRARDALLVGSVGWGAAAVLILAVTLPSPGRSAAEAATAFGICIAIGMSLSALVGLGRIADVVDPGGDAHLLRRTSLMGPVALIAGAVPGLLLAKWLVTSTTGITGSVLAGIGAGLVAAVLSGAVLAVTDLRLLHRLPSMLRRERQQKSAPARGSIAS
ncbi:murein biosynthesis integral membrane protein MurJ [Brachybacterium sp. p3-SID957]|uniref:murein biosynthesis integral membrane protein MurJ n=1 Tax=Brachybacterium sp. p3-SID957 TaxID=2916049 RepID=UPI00223B5BF3|nr:lipid II flippase MurJ [Brachybacterium sp. p3-SID957]MCT1776298.1 MATE family efflux transporter [Brachybacterium sp. p3-SID957]